MHYNSLIVCSRTTPAIYCKGRRMKANGFYMPCSHFWIGCAEHRIIYTGGRLLCIILFCMQSSQFGLCLCWLIGWLISPSVVVAPVDHMVQDSTMYWLYAMVVGNLAPRFRSLQASAVACGIDCIHILLCVDFCIHKVPTLQH